MSAFGHAGFGSRGRQNQLRAQGQMDPYGNQVRQAKQAPTFNIYSQQSQQAPSSRPATPRPQPASMPAYGGQPQTGGPMPTMGQAQPIQSSGGGTSSQQGGQIPTYDDWMRGQQQTGGPTPTYPGVTQPSTPPSQPQTGGPFPTYDDWMSGQGSSNYVNPPTGGPFPTYDSVMGPQTGGPMPTMGQAQPIPPASTGTPYAQAPATPADDGFLKWSGIRPTGPIKDPNQADRIRKMEQEKRDQWARWSPAQRAWNAAKAQTWSPQYATQMEEEYSRIEKGQANADRFNEIQSLRQKLVGGTSAQDDDILYRLNTLEGGQQISREDFLKRRQAERDDAPRAAQYKDREKFIDEWMQEQRRANMSPAEYQQSIQRTREFDKPLGAIQNDPYTNPLGLGRPYNYDAEMRRRFLASQAQLRSDMASQEQFLAGWQGTRPFEEWYSQRYGGDAKQKWSLL